MTALVLADAWRILFLAGSAPVIGAALMALIATLTGGRWPVATRAARLMPLAAVGALLLGPAQLATPAPPPLVWWLNPIAVSTRGALAVGVLWLATWSGRARSVTGAGVTLALYALLVTPIASDWMLGEVPGHAVSAVGMMLVCQQVAAAAALPLALGWGDAGQRRDLAALMVAGALGLGYLVYMDYLIVWFGNLPAHVSFYQQRGDGVAPVPLLAAIALGWAVPVAALASGHRQGRTVAGGSVLVASFLLDGWWVGGGIAAGALAALALLLVGAGSWAFHQRQRTCG